MPESFLYRQHELIADLQAQLAALKQENLDLRSRLQSCQQSQANFSQEYRLLEATAIAANALLTVPNFDKAVSTALQIIGEALDTDRVNVIENFAHPTDASLWWRVLYEWNSPGTMSQFADHQAAQGSYADIPEIYEPLHQSQPLSYLIEETPEPFRSAQVAIRVKSTHLVPIFLEGQWWGVLGIDDCREAKRRSASGLAMSKVAADCIGSAIRRERNQQALLQAEQKRSQELERINTELQQTLDLLSESEQRYRQLMELASEGIYRYEFEEPIPVNLSLQEGVQRIHQHFRVVEHNLAYAYMYGHNQLDAMVGARLSDCHIADAPENVTQMEQFVRDSRQMRNVETVEVDRFGRKRHFLNNAFDVIEDGYAIGGWGTQIDITELREAQQALLEVEQARSQELAKANEELQQRDHLLSVVAEVTKNLLGSSQAEEAITHAFQQIGEAARISRIILMHEKLEACSGRLQHHVIQEWVASGISKQMDDPVTKAIYSDEYGVLVDELHAGRSVWHVLEGFPEPARTKQAGIEVKSMGAVPIFIEGKYFGCVGFDDCIDHRQWTAYEIDVLSSGAGAIGAALHRKQLVDRLIEERIQAEQERVSELAKTNTALKNSLDRLAANPDLNAFLEHVLLEIVHQFQVELSYLYLYDAESRTLVLHRYIKHGQVQPQPELEIPAPLLKPAIADLPIWETLVQTRQPFVITRKNALQYVFRGTLEWQEQQQEQEHQTGINLLLTLRDEPIGLLGLVSTRRSFTPEELELAQALAHQATLAIQLTRLAEEAKQVAIAREQEKAAQERAAELAKANEALRQSLDALAADSDLNQFISHVLKIAAEQLDAPVVEYWSISNSTAYLELTCWQGEVFNREQLTNYPRRQVVAVPPELAAHKVLLHGQRHYIVDDLLNDSLHARLYLGLECDLEAWCNQHQVRRELNVPLRLGANIIGTLCVYVPADRLFTQQQVELSYALAQQVTLALRLTQLAEEAKQAVLLEERNRMAREIHDTLAQSFTGILVQVSAATQVLTDDLEATQAHLDMIDELARTGLAEARRSVTALRPQLLESGDLSSALHRLVTQMRSATDHVLAYEIQGTAYSLPAEVENNLLRIGQEALTNAVKYADAGEVRVELAYENAQCLLRVKDNGRGFGVVSVPLSGRFGLLGMSERAERIGAQLVIQSQPGQGTEIVVIVNRV